ncbi:MAG: phosphoribosylformylglycinamidine synthase, partial [Lachnospiraceae bacterium]|nr:phosphoribosylformylglycinamidine synthase [Lachnospiraceae bacterium]
MSNVRRIYVEKKGDYAVPAKELLADIRGYLNIKSVQAVRILVRYDIENISEETYKKALHTVFSEAPVDVCYEGNDALLTKEEDTVFSVEYLPGQFDQRADSAEQCVKLLNENEEPVIRSATTYVISGKLTQEELKAIQDHCINPVDSRLASLAVPNTLTQSFEEPENVKIFDGFQDMPEAELKQLYDSLGLAMTFRDFLHIQKYFHGEEKRDPSMTEIRVLDTYWSDHCRHTTFSTELKNVTFEEGYYRKPIQDSYDAYLANFEELYKDRDDKYVCLMDLALMAMRKLKKDGKLNDMEESDEINACSVVVPVEMDYGDHVETEEWL